MLSDNDLFNSLGKGIVIYPFKEDNIESGSIYITASSLAWSLRDVNKLDKKEIVADGIIVIPPNDTVIIVSDEVVALNNRFAGTCHSRLTISGLGLSYNSTPIKPGTCGKLLITIHNHNAYDVKIPVGERIAVIMFYQLKTKAKACRNKNHANYAVFNQLGIKLTPSENDMLQNNQCYNFEEMKMKLKENMEFKNYIKKHNRKLRLTDAAWIVTVVLLIIEIIILFKNSNNNMVNGVAVTIPLTTMLIKYIMSKRK